ncbi:DUF2138 family protein [Neisseria sp. Ec49-e6-T10]|uniref:DUF2138 family protein n=1 Tax=Neisseria sp. Ec49-e6-T10 TaxID=3140744 RepID=UPI003EBCCB6D
MTYSLPAFKKVAKYLLLFIVLAASVAGCRFFQDRKGSFTVGQVWVDMSKPDVMILSQNLARLPKDILTVPLLNQLLTEDLIFYYDNAPSKLSIQGSINRIAFEHQLSVPEQIVQKIISEPSELYVWNGSTGRPEYWMLATKNSGTTKLIQGLSKIALSDSQLIEAATIKVDGEKVPLYALYYQNHVGLFASFKDRLVFLSDAGMLFEQKETESQIPPIKTDIGYDYDNRENPVTAYDAANGENPVPKTASTAPKVNGKLLQDRVEQVELLLSAKPDNQQKIMRTVGLNMPKKGHSITANASFLAFSYQSALPGFNAVRFEFDGQKWHSEAAITPELLPERKWHSEALFQMSPADAALCASLPVNWSEMAKNTESISFVQNSKLDLNQFNDPVLMCWYENKPFSAPLLIAKLKNKEVATTQIPALTALFEQIIGAKEFENKKRFDVEKQTVTPDIVMMSRIVSARYGSHNVKDLPKTFTGKMSSQRYFPAALAVSGEYVFFSPDEDLVKQAVSVYQKNFPALSDQMQQKERTIAWVNSKQLAKLLEQQMLDALSAHSETDLRKVSQEQIKPKLDLLAKQPIWAIILDDVPTLVGSKNAKHIWLPLHWQEQNKTITP